MAKSSETRDIDTCQDRGNTQQGPTDGVQAGDDIIHLVKPDEALDHTVQGPTMPDQQQDHADDTSVSMTNSVDINGAGKDGGSEVVTQGPETTPQRQLIIILKYGPQKNIDAQISNEKGSIEPAGEISHKKSLDYVGEGSSTNAVKQEAVEDSSTNAVKQEPESATKSPLGRESAPKMSLMNGTQTTSMSDPRTVDRHGGFDDLLNKSPHEQGPNAPTKEVTGTKGRRNTDSAKRAEAADAFDMDLDQSDEAMRDPSDHGDPNVNFNEVVSETLEGRHMNEELDDKARVHEGYIGEYEDEAAAEAFGIPELKHEEDDDENEEANEFNDQASMTARYAQDAWSQHHALHEEDKEDCQCTKPSHTPAQSHGSSRLRSDVGQQQHAASHHATQPPKVVDDLHNLKLQEQMNIERLERQRQKLRENIQAAQQQQQRDRQMLVSDQSRPNMLSPPSNYSNIPPNGYPYNGFAHYPMNVQAPAYFPTTYGVLPPAVTQQLYPSHGYVMPRQTPIPLTPDDWQSGLRSGSVLPTVERPAVKKRFYDEEISDDDEPLKSRVRRHPSILSQDSVISNSSPIRASAYRRQGSNHGHSSSIESVDIKPNPKPGSSQKKPERKHHPLPEPSQESTGVPSASPSDNGIGSWKLPQFEVTREPLEKKDDVPSVKVSLPNLVREELLLSADHHDQEVHLLINLFIPGQQALGETPDPAPATAVLNFHTIAVMVIEAFVQFEIGDEFGLGRGHLHQGHKQDEEEYERLHDAKDANVDEIFFAVIDRWRAGLESKKKPLLLIRGIQEFCDVALEIIYYIKENGLPKPEPKARRVRSDKGVKRGSLQGNEGASPEKGKGKGKGRVDADGEFGEDRGKKRGATQKTNTLEARKKPKTEKVTKTKTKRKAPEISVVRRK